MIDLEPWRPKALADWLGPGINLDALAYVVVDELEEGVAGLVASPWPHVDEMGRLNFGDEEDSRHVTVRARDFLEVLKKERRPIVPLKPEETPEDALRTRALAVGDVFAARVRGGRGDPPGGDDDDGPDGGEPVDPQQWLRGEVLDITADAREAVKLQTSAALAGTFDERYVGTVGAEYFDDEHPPDSTPTDPGGDDRGGDRGGGAAKPASDAGLGATDIVVEDVTLEDITLEEDIEDAVTQPAQPVQAARPSASPPRQMEA
jgi:hypothetical protein